ncbi:MAG: hypothetical protein F6K17_37625 [Okeania sp. SIO3C4]|nr:hypothetical protein [Okeania sp. SIO3B3]NER07869.1 hypothetical protein [Okeania sp. SIO3C4]
MSESTLEQILKLATQKAEAVEIYYLSTQETDTSSQAIPGKTVHSNVTVRIHQRRRYRPNAPQRLRNALRKIPKALFFDLTYLWPNHMSIYFALSFS